MITMDNFFSIVGFLTKLLQKRIYAMDAMRSNCVGLPNALTNTKAFNAKKQRRDGLVDA